jgi:hypothetical protein
MALENGGLDAQIEQRMDAYRGNPQQLQQRYGQNKELLDLLALQKLTSEKQAASRDMQMKMQQQPGTIAQQREQEALELTKQEMGSTLGDLAGRTKSTLDQKQMTQQKNMQQMSQAAAKPQMGGAGLAGLMGGTTRPQPTPAVPPQAQGLAAARMAQGPSKFAGGGIVSFAEGQGVSGQSGIQGMQTLEEKIARINARPELDPLQKKSLINQILAQEPRPQGEPAQRMTPVGLESSARMPGQSGLVPVGSGMSQLDVMAELSPSIAPERPAAMPAPMGAPTAAPVATAPASGGITDLLSQKGQAPAPALAAVPTAGETAASFKAPQTAGAANTGVMGAQGTTSADSAFLKGTQMADEYTGRAAAGESYEGMKSRLSEFDEANYGPGDDLNAFLIGMGGTGSIGSAMKGGYNAMNRSKSNRRNRLMDEFQLEKDRIGTDAVFSASGIKLGTQLAADAAANERSIRSAAATMGAAKIRAATADADRLANVYKAELQAASDAATVAATKEKNKTALALDVAKLTAETRDNLVTAVVKDDPILQRLNMQAVAVTDDPEALALIEGNMGERMDYLSFVVDSAMNDYGLLESEENATAQLKRTLAPSRLTEDDVAGVTDDGE